VERRTEYVLDSTGWDDATLHAAAAQALSLLRPVATKAQTDIPWTRPEHWPPDVLEAAERLRDRHVSQDARHKNYMCTDEVDLVDEQDRDDFLTFAPHALDATIWGPEGELAEVSDRGWSLVVSLTASEAEALGRTLEPGRLMTLEEWHSSRPSIRRSVAAWLKRMTAGR
jgi:hypothetical protein